MAHRRDCPAAWEPTRECGCGENSGERQHVAGCSAGVDENGNSFGSCSCDELIRWNNDNSAHIYNPEYPEPSRHRPGCGAGYEYDHPCTCNKRR